MNSTHPITTATLTKPTIPPSWSSEILPTTLESHGLRCQDQTPASAQHLLSQGQLTAEDFIESLPDIERTLMEAFIEDDYDGKLHLTTLSMATSNTTTGNATKEEIVGMAFWREVPSEEMTDWMDLHRISKAIAERKLTSSNSTVIDHEHHDLSHNAKQSMKLARRDSIGWIQKALKPCENNDNGASTMNEHQLPSKSTIHKLTHAWIKIELIAIKRTHRAHHLGNVLLGCTLAKAHALHHNEHAILHIAGGGASKNIPAARLYTRYGFVSVPQHEEGGPFVKPDRDLFVLGNIGMVLNALPWEEMMQISSAHGVEDSSGGKRQRSLQDQSDSNCKDDEDDGETK